MSGQGNVRQADTGGIAATVEILKRGGLAALPTETVYGLAADAANAAAVAKLYAAKGRPQFNPLIAHVATREAAEGLGRFNSAAFALAEEFWPGPLTLVLNYHGGGKVCDLARAGLDTVAVRLPRHPVMRAVLEKFGGSLVAPSANLSCHVSATSAEHVAEDFGSSVDIILDGGPSQLGLESTIVDLTGKTPRLLREGALDKAEIESVLGMPFTKSQNDPARPSSPGQLSAHYAPGTPLHLNARSVEPDEALLAFGVPLPGAKVTLNLSESEDTAEAAVHLFSHLRALDKTGARSIAVMPIPETGLGAAINDRLRRAALGRH